MMWPGFDLDLSVVTLTFKILYGPYLNCKLYEVDSWMGHWLEGAGVKHHGVTLI